ncbi:hypothetical protein B0H13DRAFT_1851497 [Mycena leptocephala]|nr:hypothetical protein B0H13DRAFT_1851497 [Mycena leptocephala]
MVEGCYSNLLEFVWGEKTDGKELSGREGESPHPVVVSTPPRKSGEQNSGQTLRRDFKPKEALERAQTTSKIKQEPQKPVNEGPKKRSSKSVVGRLPPRGFFEQVICDTKRVGQPPSPPDDPSHSSSSSEASSSSDDESEAAGADSTPEIANDVHRKKPKMITKPIPLNKGYLPESTRRPRSVI